MINDHPDPNGNLVLPLAAERLVIGKRMVDRERVRVSTRISEHQETASVELLEDVIEVERVPLGHEVNIAPDIRHDGDLLIVPVVKEVVVKRLVLVEEVRLRRVRRVERFEQPIMLRSMEATVERKDLIKEKDQ